MSGVMKETIDLSSVDLTNYGLTKDAEISVPYPTLLGCVYVVRDHSKSPEHTYLFVTTKDKVMFHDTGFENSGKIYLEKGTDSITESYSLNIIDLDGEKGEEIVLLSDTGGNGGMGIYEHGIYKISNDKIVKMKISNEKPFDITLEAPYTVAFRNEKFDFEKTLVCKSDSESLFDDNGSPEHDNYDGGFYPPHSVLIYSSSDEKSTVTFSSYSYLSRSMDDQQVVSDVEYVYDVAKKQFVISDVNVSAREPDYNNDIYQSEEEYFESLSYTNGYIYYDINKDGVDEFITQTGTCEADRVYRIYTFEEGKMYCAGELGGWHGSLHRNNNNEVVVVSTGAAIEGSFVSYTAYKLADNKLIEVKTFEKVLTSDAEYEEFFDDFEKSNKTIKIENLYYR